MTDNRSDVRKAAEAEYQQQQPAPEAPIKEVEFRRPQVVGANHDTRLWIEITRSYSRRAEIALRFSDKTTLNINPDELRILKAEIDRALEDYAQADEYRTAFEAYELAQRQWEDDKRDFVSAAVAKWEAAQPGATASDDDDDDDDEFEDYDEEDEDL